MGTWRNRRGAGHLGRLRGALIGAGLMAALAVGGPARAVDGIIETSAITNSYLFGFDGYGPQVIAGANASHRERQTDSSGFVSELGFDLTSALDPGGSFNFLHNAYCVGTCSIQIHTTIVFTLQNVSDADAYLRFDSIITPGHLAQTRIADGSDGYFTFVVLQADPVTTDNTILYQAFGTPNQGFPVFETDGLTFNGFRHDDNGTDWQVIDWSATHLNIDLLVIPAGTTRQLHYISTVVMNNVADCTALEDCAGIQIAFGDPRTTGGGGTNQLGAFGAATTPTAPVIGREFDVYRPASNFALASTAPPDEPLEVEPEVIYVDDFKPQATPEPGTWLMMIAGFGTVGGLFRRRSAGLPA